MGDGRGKGDWLRVFEVPVPFPGEVPRARSDGLGGARRKGERHLEDSEPVPFFASGLPSACAIFEGPVSSPGDGPGARSRRPGQAGGQVSVVSGGRVYSPSGRSHLPPDARNSDGTGTRLGFVQTAMAVVNTSCVPLQSLSKTHR